jgi:hypothetical protein
VVELHDHHPQAVAGSAADPAFDLHGLEDIVERLQRPDTPPA